MARAGGLAAPWGLVCTLAVLAATACGYTESGTGSRTLQVNGTVAYSLASAKDASFLSVSVAKEGVPVTTALVIAIDGDTDERFTVPAVDAKYAGTWPGYHRRIAWRIVAGDDNVASQLEGPGRHTVSAPTHASVHKLGEPLHVAWGTADGVRGEQVTVRLTPSAYTSPGGYEATLASDDGSVRINAPNLEPGLATISVTRRTAVAPAGAVPPSTLSYTYEVLNEFLVNAP